MKRLKPKTPFNSTWVYPKFRHSNLHSTWKPTQTEKSSTRHILYNAYALANWLVQLVYWYSPSDVYQRRPHDDDAAPRFFHRVASWDRTTRQDESSAPPRRRRCSVLPGERTQHKPLETADRPSWRASSPSRRRRLSATLVIFHESFYTLPTAQSISRLSAGYKLLLEDACLAY